MQDKFKGEIWRLSFALYLSLLLGIYSGYWARSLVFGLGAYIAWLLFQIYVFESWLASGQVKPSTPLVGIWRQAARTIERTGNRSRKRKKRFSQSIQRFNRTLEAMPDAAVILSSKLKVEWYNANAQRLLGLPRFRKKGGGATGSRISDEYLSRYLEQGAFDEPIELPSPNDPLVELEVRVVNFADGQYLMTAHDITQIKHIHAVRRRFIADVSHELRTPLTVINGYLELLTEEELPEEVLQAIHASQRQAARMQSIVGDLLMLSRLEMDEGTPLEGEPVNVSELLEGLVADAEQLSAERGHRFRLSVDSALLLKGSEAELTGAFGNLLFNAVNHTPGGTAIDIRWGEYAQGARLEVADDGPGIEQDHVRRLTERFYRVDKGRSRKSGGTGLGLSIVKHVMNHHDGRVEIRSVVGAGSRFMCIFPEGRILRQAEKT